MTEKSLRVALTTDDFERAITFYRDGLGLNPGDLWTECAVALFGWPADYAFSAPKRIES